jgi:hypothetical protein
MSRDRQERLAGEMIAARQGLARRYEGRLLDERTFRAIEGDIAAILNPYVEDGTIVRFATRASAASGFVETWVWAPGVPGGRAFILRIPQSPEKISLTQKGA